MDNNHLKDLLISGNPEFWIQFNEYGQKDSHIHDILKLVALKKKALTRGMSPPWQNSRKTRMAILGGYTLHPLHELISHFCELQGEPCEIQLGDFDNYISEIMDQESDFHRFSPEVALIIPSANRCRYTGRIADSRADQEKAVSESVESLLDLCRRANEKSGTEVILCNFILPAGHDPGAFRVRSLANDWNFKKLVNLELGLSAPSYVQICDLEFLAYRCGGLMSRDFRSWYESKQLCSSSLMPLIAREISHLVTGLRKPAKKVLVLDLDNTLWGGVVADDGLEGIEIGDTSPRGEAFKAFQHYISTLKHRGILLAVCSKNDHHRVAEAFEKHPEMVLRMEDFVSFKANWEPKSENIRIMASELNLGLDSFLFVDDNPAEIEIVRQFVPEVTCIQLTADPSEYVSQLQDSRHFEHRSITQEDAERTFLYRTEVQRRASLQTVTDMDSYLESLGMEAEILEFNDLDIPRLSQLINKSNQFNLTTRRRSEGELQALMQDPSFVGFSIRLRDRFGDHGLIAIVIMEKSSDVFLVDTWLMSCRVLKRQVEEITLNEMARLAVLHGCHVIKGFYLPTAKNLMVADLYPKMGFDTLSEIETEKIFQLEINSYQPQKTHITITKKSYE